MKKTFYLMRHGETLFNVRRKIQGWCDSPLTINGIQQAEKAAAFFNNINLDHLYSSTAERSCDTAEIVTRNGMPYQRLKGLREMNFGCFEGESEDLHPERTMRATHYLQFGGESHEMVRERVVQTCTEIMEKADHHCVLAVAHSGSCKRFLEQWHNIDEALAAGIPNCCIFQYEYENQQFQLVEIFRLPE